MKKTALKKTALLLPVALLLTSLPCAAQGPLSPPGPPAPTMKTLEQIEPRTPISSLPYTITNSGSYYVVSNLHSTTDGIVIETNGVSVDLMGFSLTGDGGSGDYGIHVAGAPNAPIEDLVITGGRISGFFRGLSCEYMNNSRIEQMVVSDNANVGVYLDGNNSDQCDGNTISDCNIRGNGLGVYLRGDTSGQCNGNTIANCTVSENNAYGVYLDGDNSGQCNGNTISDCNISDNNSVGVYLRGYIGQCNGNTIANCSISDNTNYGVYLNGSSSGQCDGNRVHGNQISKNVNRGIYLSHANGNRVEANNVWGTTGATSYGIRTANTTDNFILKNTCVGQTNNFLLDSDDTYGPIVTNSGALPTSGAAAHPWANFSR